MAASGEWVLSAPAKINLFLDVGSLRSDGYHEVVSILQTVALCDRLTLRRSSAPGLLLSVPDRILPAGVENTIYKAHQLFSRLCPEVPGLSVTLEKRIPVQAGLGGGSSDAGVFLRYLWETYAPELAEEQVVGIAAEVGSDVPFFLYGGTCLVEGRGERVTSLPSLPALPVLLFHPPVAVSTREAYRALDEHPERGHPSVEPMKAAITEGHWDQVLEGLYNSFEEPVFARHQALVEIKAFCLEQGFPHVLLAGSGSNLFVLGQDERVRALQQAAQKQLKEVETTLTHTMQAGPNI